MCYLKYLQISLNDTGVIRAILAQFSRSSEIIIIQIIDVDIMIEEPYDISPLTMIHEVFPGDTNDYGTMFGGNVIALMDKAAGICASKFAHENFVTASVDRLKFLAPIKQGHVVEATAKVVYTSKHTAGLEVIVTSRDRKTWIPQHCCRAYFFMVAMGANGEIKEIPQFVPVKEKEKERFEKVGAIHRRIRK